MHNPMLSEQIFTFDQGAGPMQFKLLKILRESRAATAIEYGLIAALIALAALGAISAFADGAIGKWNFIQTSVKNSS